MTTKWQADTERGVSLIEVMVAVLVLSIGWEWLRLWGSRCAIPRVPTTGLRRLILHTSTLTRREPIYIDTARAYIAIGGGDKLGYILQPAWSAANCDIATAPLYNCGGGLDSLNCDIRRLGDHVCRVLPGGRLRATAVPLGGNPDRLQLTVDICWTDDRSGAGAVTEACNSDSETLFTLVTEL